MERPRQAPFQAHANGHENVTRELEQLAILNIIVLVGILHIVAHALGA